ncbi:MAG: 4-(cytidine 5'-diphospho)-2-C-methyl-D-erythritol kinase [Atopobiaceae bacterium]
MESIAVKAPAKVNLYLGVHRDRDERGYHRVDSVMAAVDFGDVVTFEPAERLAVSCEPGIRAHMDHTTTYRAVEALGKAFGHNPAFAVHIERHIPERSGMGGSSTDAGAALRGACALWDIDPEDPRVVAIARSIGADIAFFLKPDVSYLAGAGDVLEEQFPTPELSLAVVRPPVTGSCAQDAYAAFDRNPQALPPLAPYLEALRTGNLNAIVEKSTNNLAAAAIALEPELGRALAWFRSRPHVLNAQVSGSGACLFAICDSASAAEEVALDAKENRNWWAISSKVVDSSRIFC